jgi:hypothetical protein
MQQVYIILIPISSTTVATTSSTNPYALLSLSLKPSYSLFLSNPSHSYRIPSLSLSLSEDTNFFFPLLPMAATEAKAEAKDAPKEVVEETLAPLRGKVKLIYIMVSLKTFFFLDKISTLACA